VAERLPAIAPGGIEAEPSSQRAGSVVIGRQELFEPKRSLIGALLAKQCLAGD